MAVPSLCHSQELSVCTQISTCMHIAFNGDITHSDDISGIIVMSCMHLQEFNVHHCCAGFPTHWRGHC